MSRLESSRIYNLDYMSGVVTATWIIRLSKQFREREIKGKLVSWLFNRRCI